MKDGGHKQVCMPFRCASDSIPMEMDSADEKSNNYKAFIPHAAISTDISAPK